jgi:phospholipid/cholesterol/gamma-HCH transport system substrate-binding protein
MAVATTSPPSPPAAPPPPPPPSRGSSSPAPNIPSPRARRGRILAVGALALVVLIVAFLLFGGSGGANYKLEFAEADQLVRGDQVQVGGVPVGSVTGIELTHDYKALVTIHVDSSLAPLHAGTVAQVRVPSLSSVANRYVALTPAPNKPNPPLADGATLPASATKEVTDLDALFNTLDPKTRKGLQEFIQGSAAQYVGASRQLGQTTELFPAFFNGNSHFFNELASDQKTLTTFLVETAKTVTTIGARQQSLSDLIENQNTTFQAIGSEQAALAQGLKALPGTLRQGNKTFEELPSTLGALTTFINTSKPTTKSLTLLLERLRPLLTTATPTLHNLNVAFSQPGPNNDLTDLVNVLPQLAKTLSTASPVNVQALKESVPITAFLGPYSPDLAGTLRTFGQAASYYDANGHYARVTPVFPSFKLESSKNNLVPTSGAEALKGLEAGQLRRCPGAATQPAADGSSPFSDNELLSCDPLETP